MNAPVVLVAVEPNVNGFVSAALDVDEDAAPKLKLGLLGAADEEPKILVDGAAAVFVEPNTGVLALESAGLPNPLKRDVFEPGVDVDVDG